MSVKCSCPPSHGLDRNLVDENIKNGLFFVIELKRLSGHQLSSALRCCRKSDKSTNRNVKFSNVRNSSLDSCVKCLLNVLSLCGHALILLTLKLSLLATLQLLLLLLIRAGIEPNLWPDESLSFQVLSQNCRGLTDRDKLIRLVRKIYPRKPSSHISTVSRLQETHLMDKFTLSNSFQGAFVIDDGERSQRGTCILVPASFEICGSSTNGIGSWIIAVVKSKASLQKFVITNIYAPNCHREASNFYQDFFGRLDEGTAELLRQGGSCNVDVTGDFNVVLDPILGATNRTSTRAEQDLATLITNAMSTRELLEALSLTQPNCFTWRRGICLSKLDYIFMSRTLASKV